jgi:hypothetical protein
MLQGDAMKKTRAVTLLLIAFFALSACGKTLKGTDALIEKAREEIPISDADTIEMQYAGLSGKEDKVLLWFISGNEYQAHYYLPMECSVAGTDEYTFEKTYKPMIRAADIAVLQWMNGYAFLVNNPKCSVIKITDAAGTHEEIIEENSYPYVFYYEQIPTEYAFLDEAGNEIT